MIGFGILRQSREKLVKELVGLALVAICGAFFEKIPWIDLLSLGDPTSDIGYFRLASQWVEYPDDTASEPQSRPDNDIFVVVFGDEMKTENVPPKAKEFLARCDDGHGRIYSTKLLHAWLPLEATDRSAYKIPIQERAPVEPRLTKEPLGGREADLALSGLSLQVLQVQGAERANCTLQIWGDDRPLPAFRIYTRRDINSVLVPSLAFVFLVIGVAVTAVALDRQERAAAAEEEPVEKQAEGAATAAG